MIKKGNPSKCMVTGAAGYLGSVLVRKLYELGYSVISLALPGENADYIAPYSEVRYADVCDKAALERAARDADVIIHLAGIIDIGTRHRALIRRVNVGGTRNVAEFCKERGKRMIYCSSVHAIPCLPDDGVMTETREFDPDKVRGLYSKTKAEATAMVLAMAAEGLDVMVAFPSGIIGPYERRLSNIGQVISDFLCGRLTAYIDGQYNFVDVRDVASGLIGMVEHWHSGECYILSGEVITVKRMIEVIAAAGEKKMIKTKLPHWFIMSTGYLAEFYYFIMRKKPLFTYYSIRTLRDNCNFSNQKARSEIGFSARPAQESLTDMTRWIMAHFVAESNKNRKFKPSAYRV